MLNIGAFAQLGQVSPRTLRHYDDLGLLVPQRVDPMTGYRSYDLGQLARLHRILALRDLGFALDQIGVVLHFGFGISGERLPEGDGVVVRELPVIEVASVVHHGSMDEVEPVYEALVRWIEDSGYQIAGYSRELYLEFHADDMTKNVTEL